MYLMVTGGILFTLEVLVLLVFSTPYNIDIIYDDNEKILAVLMPLVAFAMFAVTIWGSVVVFGKSNEYLTLLT